MTTLEPGASEVFTHGLAASPRSTAFFASSPAPTITDGLDVLVHEVIEAITTAPWSISYAVPPDVVTGVGLLARVSPGVRAGSGGAGRSLPWAAAPAAGGSLAGNDSAEPSSAAS